MDTFCIHPESIDVEIQQQPFYLTIYHHEKF